MLTNTNYQLHHQQNLIPSAANMINNAQFNPGIAHQLNQHQFQSAAGATEKYLSNGNMGSFPLTTPTASAGMIGATGYQQHPSLFIAPFLPLNFLCTPFPLHPSQLVPFPAGLNSIVPTASPNPMLSNHQGGTAASATKMLQMAANPFRQQNASGEGLLQQQQQQKMLPQQLFYPTQTQQPPQTIYFPATSSVIDQNNNNIRENPTTTKEISAANKCSSVQQKQRIGTLKETTPYQPSTASGGMKSSQLENLNNNNKNNSDRNGRKRSLLLEPSEATSLTTIESTINDNSSPKQVNSCNSADSGFESPSEAMPATTMMMVRDSSSRVPPESTIFPHLPEKSVANQQQNSLHKHKEGFSLQPKPRFLSSNRHQFQQLKSSSCLTIGGVKWHGLSRKISREEEMVLTEKEISSKNTLRTSSPNIEPCSSSSGNHILKCSSKNGTVSDSRKLPSNSVENLTETIKYLNKANGEMGVKIPLLKAQPETTFNEGQNTVQSLNKALPIGIAKPEDLLEKKTTTDIVVTKAEEESPYISDVNSGDDTVVHSQIQRSTGLSCHRKADDEDSENSRSSRLLRILEAFKSRNRSKKAKLELSPEEALKNNHLCQLLLREDKDDERPNNNNNNNNKLINSAIVEKGEKDEKKGSCLSHVEPAGGEYPRRRGKRKQTTTAASSEDNNNKPQKATTVGKQPLELIQPAQQPEEQGETEQQGGVLCEWFNCTEVFKDHNYLYDHVLSEHLEEIRPEAGASSKKGPGRPADKFRCRWNGCHISLKRGDLNKKFEWLREHFTARHAQKAQPFKCLFADCSLRFRNKRSLHDHLGSAHDSSREGNLATVKRNTVESEKSNRQQASCYGFRPHVVLPSSGHDIIDSRTIEWIRKRLRKFDESEVATASISEASKNNTTFLTCSSPISRHRSSSRRRKSTPKSIPITEPLQIEIPHHQQEDNCEEKHSLSYELDNNFPPARKICKNNHSMMRTYLRAH